MSKITDMKNFKFYMASINCSTHSRKKIIFGFVILTYFLPVLYIINIQDTYQFICELI